MVRRTRQMPTLAWVYVVAVAVLTITTLRGAPADEVVWKTLVVAYTVVGAFIVHRQPGHAIGWLLLVPGLAVISDFGTRSLAQPADEFTVRLLVDIWVDNYAWLLVIFPIILLLALFPTGRPLSPRWRWHTRIVIGMTLLLVVWGSLMREIGPLEGHWTIDNPIGVLPNPADLAWFMPLWALGLIAITIGSLVSMVLRFRRGDRVERTQVKWLLYAASFFAAVYVPFAIFHEVMPGLLFELLLAGSLLFVPVAMAIAILRYQVFDIDVVIRRTVVYVVVAGVLVATYTASVVLLQSMVGEALGLDSSLGVAGSTLIVVALFHPVRRQVHRVVSRRFFRLPYDTNAIVTGFGATVRDQTDPDRVQAELAETVTSTLHPSTIGLWLPAPWTTSPD